MTILIDNGHGIETLGKRSPVLDDGGVFAEWSYVRLIAERIEQNAPSDIHVRYIVPEVRDVSLSVRARRANVYIQSNPQEQCVFFSIHGNAAGDGKTWHSARGFECFTTRGQNNSDRLAECLYEQIQRHLPNVRLRKDVTDGDSDKEKDFTVLKLVKCPAVLSECLFYTNIEDLAMMTDDAVVTEIAVAHIDAALQYFNTLRK